MYVTGLSITDGVEVLTKVLPELIKKAQKRIMSMMKDILMK